MNNYPLAEFLAAERTYRAALDTGAESSCCSECQGKNTMRIDEARANLIVTAQRLAPYLRDMTGAKS